MHGNKILFVCHKSLNGAIVDLSSPNTGSSQNNTWNNELFHRECCKNEDRITAKYAPWAASACAVASSRVE